MIYHLFELAGSTDTNGIMTKIKETKNT